MEEVRLIIESLKDFSNKYPTLTIDLETVIDCLDEWDGESPTADEVMKRLEEDFCVGDA